MGGVRHRWLEGLEAVLDLRVLTMKSLQRSDVLLVLVGDEALEAMPVHVSDCECSAL
jgi:hypothetical protein